VPVKVETARLFLLGMSDAEKELQEATTDDSKISIYETMLKQCIDAQQALRDSLQDDAVSHSILPPCPSIFTYGWQCLLLQ
jgi:hypothetical protein